MTAALQVCATGNSAICMKLGAARSSLHAFASRVAALEGSSVPVVLTVEVHSTEH